MTPPGRSEPTLVTTAPALGAQAWDRARGLLWVGIAALWIVNLFGLAPKPWSGLVASSVTLIAGFDPVLRLVTGLRRKEAPFVAPQPSGLIGNPGIDRARQAADRVASESGRARMLGWLVVTGALLLFTTFQFFKSAAEIVGPMLAKLCGRAPLPHPAGFAGCPSPQRGREVKPVAGP